MVVGCACILQPFNIRVAHKRHDEIDAFHHHPNEQNTDIQFTREVEENGKLPFLDCLVSRDDNSLRTTGNRHIPTDYWTSHPTTRHHTKPLPSGLLPDERNQYAIRQTAYPTRTSTLTVFFQRTTTTKTSSNVTLTDLLLLPKLTTTQLLQPQQLYRT